MGGLGTPLTLIAGRARRRPGRFMLAALRIALAEAGAMAVATLLARAATDDGQTVVCATHDPEVIGRAHEVLAL